MKIRLRSTKTAALLVMAVILVTALIVNSTISYFVRKKTAHNLLSVGIVELKIEEDSFPENKKDRWLVPKSYLPKNPRFVNTGNTDVYAFAEVTVPYDNIHLIIEQGENADMPDPSGKKNRELFNLLSDASETSAGSATAGFTAGFTVTDNGEFTYQKNWIFISSKEDTTARTHSYLFGYKSMMTTDQGHNTTTEIFDKVQLRNIMEGDLPENEERTINVKARAVQSEELAGNITIADTDDLTKEELVSIYSYIQNQEG